jgi:hypothetical protein
MKLFKLAAWVTGIVGTVILLIAIVSLIIGQNIFGFKHVINYVHTANSFLLLAILCVLAHNGCVSNKEK